MKQLLQVVEVCSPCKAQNPFLVNFKYFTTIAIVLLMAKQLTPGAGAGGLKAQLACHKQQPQYKSDLDLKVPGF